MTICKNMSVVMLDLDRGQKLHVGVQVRLDDFREWSTVFFFLLLVPEEAPCWGEVLQLSCNRISSPSVSKVTVDTLGCLRSQIKESLGSNFWAWSLKFCSRCALVSQQQILNAGWGTIQWKICFELHLSECLLCLFINPNSEPIGRLCTAV